MSKSEVIRENEQLRAAYQQAHRRATPANFIVVVLACTLFAVVGYLLAGGTRPELPWLRPPSITFPTPAIVIRDAVPAFVPPSAPQEPQRGTEGARAAPAVVAPASIPTAQPAPPASLKILVIRPADGGAPIVVTRGTKYRSRP